MQTQFLNRMREQVGLTDRLLPANQKRLTFTSVAALCDLNLDEEGANRRTIGLLPQPTTRQEHDISETDCLRLKQLLLSLEAKETSCCIKVFSNQRKSRSSLLIYRGRLIGCVFGRRGLSDQLFGKQAFEQILEDMVSPSNVIDAYPLTDEMVLATAALFHGGLNGVFNGAPAVCVYPSCTQMMIRNKRTGCIVVNDNEESALCVTYIFEGQIVGVYSFSAGWLTKTQAAALGCFESKPDVEILIGILPVDCQSASLLTESLTGLDSYFESAGLGARQMNASAK